MLVGYPSDRDPKVVADDGGPLEAGELEAGAAKDASEGDEPDATHHVDDASMTADDAAVAHDANVTDADLSADAGPVDIDASMPDAAMPDAGAQDASTLDATAPDADIVAMQPPTPFEDAGTTPFADASVKDAAVADAGAKDAAVADAGAPPATCAGARALNSCWYLGTWGQSCSDLCSGHGGYDPRTNTLVGTSSQGGSWDNCRVVLNALGFPLPPIRAYLTDGYSNGCNQFYTLITYWLDDPTPDFNQNRSSPYARIACGCKK